MTTALVPTLEPEPSTIEPGGRRRGSVFGPRQRKRSNWRINLARLGVVVVILGIWELVTVTGLVNPILLPTPVAVAQDFVGMILDGSLITNSLVTLQATAIGFVIGMAAGVIFGFFIGLSEAATKVAAPFITVLNSMPRIALAPMFVLWFGIGLASGVALVISLVIFVALTNTIAGTRSVDRGQLTMAKLYGSSRLQTIRKIILPATAPWILAAGHLGLALSLSGAIVSEMFLGQSGLGFLIVTSSGLFNMGRTFAAIFMALIIASILEGLGILLETYVLRWRPPVQG